MGTLINDLKMGFYPSDQKWVGPIANYLKGGINRLDFVEILDPVAGDGFILDVANRLGVTALMNEIDDGRFKEIKKKINRAGKHAVTHGDIYTLSYRGRASVLYLNPPYGYDSERGGRMELNMLKFATKWLSQMGYLFFVIYDHNFNEEMKAFIKEHYYDAKYYNAGAHLSYNQIVVIARKLPLVKKGFYLSCELDSPSGYIEGEYFHASNGHIVISGEVPPATYGIIEQVNWTEADYAHRAEALKRHMETPYDGKVEAVDIRPHGYINRSQQAALLTAGALNCLVVDHPALGSSLASGYSRQMIEHSRNFYDEYGHVKSREYVVKPQARISLMNKSGDYLFMTPIEFMQNFPEKLREIERAIEPIISETEPDWDLMGEVKILGKYPLIGSQKAMAWATYTRMIENKSAVISAEPGVGKTGIALSVMNALMKQKNISGKVVLVVCPNHLIPMWERNLQEAFPDAHVANLMPKGKTRPTTNYRKLVERKAQNPHQLHVGIVGPYYLGSKESAYPFFATKHMRYDAGDGNPTSLDKYMVHPDTFEPFMVAGKPVKLEDFLERPNRNTAVWAITRAKTGTYKEPIAPVKDTCPFPLSEFIKAKHRQSLGLVILDEAHMYRHDSNRTEGAIQIATIAKYTMMLTGTFYSGMASESHTLLTMLDKSIASKYPRTPKGIEDWVKVMGAQKVVTKNNKVPTLTSLHDKGNVSNEIAGASTILISAILKNGISVLQPDLGIPIPPIDYEIVEVEMSKQEKDAYNTVVNGINGAIKVLPEFFNIITLQAQMLLFRQLNVRKPFPYSITLNSRQKSITQAADHALRQAYPSVVYNGTARTIKIADGCTLTGPTEKEKVLCEMVQASIDENRPVIVFTELTGDYQLDTQVYDQIKQLTTANPFALTEKTKAHDREKVILENLENGKNVMVVNPALIREGLDLTAFKTAIFHTTPTSLITTVQAAGRIRRAIQPDPCKVYILVYKDSAEQERLIKLVSRLVNSAIVSGDDTYSDVTSTSHSNEKMRSMIDLVKQMLSETDDKANTPTGAEWADFTSSQERQLWSEMMIDRGQTATVPTEHKAQVVPPVSIFKGVGPIGKHIQPSLF